VPTQLEPPLQELLRGFGLGPIRLSTSMFRLGLLAAAVPRLLRSLTISGNEIGRQARAGLRKSRGEA
jgi:hypothetical protein